MPTTVDQVIARMREIDGELPRRDGAAVFNRLYLTVTERIGALIGEGTFADDEFMADLDVRFASLWLTAYDDAQARRSGSRAWKPLFEARKKRLLPIQFALAGMNSHIEHDLPIAVVQTCQARGTSIRRRKVREDYEAVNDVLAEVEAEIRRSFLDDFQKRVDDHVGAVVHLVSAWNIDKARDVAWVSAETMWALRRTTFLMGSYVSGLAHTVGMGSRYLLTPTGLS